MLCLVCKKKIPKDRFHTTRKRKYCSLKCMYDLWKREGRQNYRGKNTAQWKGGMKNSICKVCRKIFKFYPTTQKGWFCSKSCSGKYTRQNQLLVGAKNPVWKGNAVSYHVLHKWVKRHKPKPTNCERCGTKTSILDLANKSHKYFRYLNDYWYLCKACHHIIDWQKDRRDGKGRWKSPRVAPSRIRLQR